MVGVGFNVQADGSSALAVTAEHAEPGTTVMFDSIALPTSVQSEQAVTAFVPAEFLSQAAAHRITLRNQSGESAAVAFTVVTPPVLPPVLRAVQPAQATAGTGFDVQSDGSSRLTLEADQISRGAWTTFDGVSLPTTVESDTRVTVAVPAEFLAAAGPHQIRLHSPAGESAPLPFVVTEGALAPAVLTALDPPSTAVDTPFAVQPDGTSALRLEAEGDARPTCSGAP